MKKALRTILLSVLMLAALVSTVQAKEVYKAVTAKQNTWYTPKTIDSKWNGSDFVWTNYRYKITVPAGSYVRVTFKSDDGWIEIYKTLAGQKEIMNVGSSSDSVKTYNFVLPKGTYFLRGYEKYRFKYQFIKYKNKANYKASKAVWLKAGKKTAVVQSRGHNYDRWYKIKLTKKKRVTVWGPEDVAIYDAKHQYVRVTKDYNADGNKHSSYDKLKAGTYYIRVFGDRPYGSYLPWFGSVSILRWN